MDARLCIRYLRNLEIKLHFKLLKSLRRITSCQQMTGCTLAAMQLQGTSISFQDHVNRINVALFHRCQIDRHIMQKDTSARLVAYLYPRDECCLVFLYDP
jgi:hypothetical protein